MDWADANQHSLVQREYTGRRSKGVHLSGCIRAALVDLKLLTTQQLDEETMPLRMWFGMALEDRAVQLVAAQSNFFIWQPGEVEVDGVVGSPDGTNQMTLDALQVPKAERADLTRSQIRYLPVLEEFKCTWKSQHNYGNVEQQALWMWQLAGYCYMLGYRYARLHVFWVNGNYRPPAPDYRVYLLKFGEEELERFWQTVVLKYRDKAEKE